MAMLLTIIDSFISLVDLQYVLDVINVATVIATAETDDITTLTTGT